MKLLDRDNGLGRTTAMLLLITVCLGFLHHTDHILRVDHSGWPFRPDINPFTYSLLVEPAILFALLGPGRFFWLRWVVLAVATGFTLFAHTFIETPQMQYAMWAYDQSLEPRYWNIHNLCGVQSGAIGWIAVILAMLVNVFLVTATIAMLVDGLKRRGQVERLGDSRSGPTAARSSGRDVLP